MWFLVSCCVLFRTVRASQPDSPPPGRTVRVEGQTVHLPDGPRVHQTVRPFLADGPRDFGGQSVRLWRTVRETLADSPRLPGSFGLNLPCFDSSFRCFFLGSFLEVLSV